MTDCFSAKDPELKQAFEKLCLEQTGVKLKILNSPRHFWELFLISRINLGDAADIIKAPANLLPLITQNKLLPLNPFMENSPAMSRLYVRSPQNFDTYCFEGQFYGIGKNRISSKCLWVRKDILNKWKLTFPATMEEVKNMLIFLKNHERELFPLVFSNNMKDLSIFASAFGLRMEVYQKNKIFYEPFFQESFPSFAAYIRGFYEAGLFTPDFPSLISYHHTRDLFGEGKGSSIIMWDNIYSALHQRLTRAGIQNFEILPLPPFSTEEGVFGIEYLPPLEPFAITSKCKNPQAAFKVLEWIFTREGGILASSLGIEGLSYRIDKNNTAQMETTLHLGQGFPWVNRDFSPSFSLPEHIQRSMDYCNAVMDAVHLHEQRLPQKIMMPRNRLYSSLYFELQEQRARLFFAYVQGKMSYEDMMKKFKTFYRQKGLFEILDEMNSTSPGEFHAP